MFAIGYNNSNDHYSTNTHCERPERINYTISRLEKVYSKSHFITCPNPNVTRCLDLISLAHSQEHIKLLTKPKFNIWMCRTCSKPLYSDTKRTFEKFIEYQQKCYFCETKLTTSNIYTHIDGDTYFTYATPQIVYEGIGVLDNLIQRIVLKQITCGFALIRPPGHHCCNKASGFCICNNVVVATRAAQNLGLNKVIILDIDFHHGDGTQKLITDENLLYKQIKNTKMVSIHGYGPGIYPGTGSTSESTENVLNIPVHITREPESRLYANDEFYQGIITNQVIPWIDEFNPDLFIVSLGVDAHSQDSLEGLNITDKTYVMIAETLHKYNKPVLFVLEGGYNVQVIYSVVSKIIKIFK